MGKGQDRGVRLYIEALDLSGVAVGGPVTRDAAFVGSIEAFAELPAGKALITRTFWCASAAHARLVIGAARMRLAADGMTGWAAVSPDAAAESVMAVADDLGAILQDDASVKQRAVEAVARIEAEFEAMRKAGGLKSVNKSYQQYRLALTAAGQKVLPYSLWIENYKADMIRMVANSARTLDRQSFGNLEIG